MASSKEIRGKIQSIKNTQKTTRAMEMVAASKMRKTQKRMEKTRPYAHKIHQVISHLARANSEYHHPYLYKREVKRIGIIVVSTDRGLCGGLNINLFRKVVSAMKTWDAQGCEIDLALFGRKAESFFKRFGGKVIAAKTHLGDRPQLDDIIGSVKVMLDAYDNGKVDALYLAYNEFANTMTQQPTIEQILPLEPAPDESLKHYWDYIYEPDAKELLDQLLKRFIESQVFQAVVENIACQQAATMVAMKNASDNAGELIKEFQLAYNKARQAAITQEIAEIVGGAAAV